jgi:hypothetical protein
MNDGFAGTDVADNDGALRTGRLEMASDAGPFLDLEGGA